MTAQLDEARRHAVTFGELELRPGQTLADRIRRTPVWAGAGGDDAGELPAERAVEAATAERKLVRGG